MIPLQNYIKKTTFIHHPVKNIKNYNKRAFMAKICRRGSIKRTARERWLSGSSVEGAVTYSPTFAVPSAR